jgi:hypothetical protein
VYKELVVTKGTAYNKIEAYERGIKRIENNNREGKEIRGRDVDLGNEKQRREIDGRSDGRLSHSLFRSRRASSLSRGVVILPGHPHTVGLTILLPS